MKKILPNRYKTMNCIENCFANVCDAYSIDYRPLFLLSWDFGYDDTKPTIGERIHYHNSHELEIDNYIDIAFKYLRLNCEENISECGLSKSTIQEDHFYIISTDSFDCQWNLAYQKHHYQHYFLVEKMDVTNSIVGIDSFSSSSLQYLTADYLKTLRKFYRICFLENKADRFWQQEFKRTYSEFILSQIQIGIFNKMNFFACELLELDDIHSLSPQIIDISNTYIIRRLNYIANSRYNTMLLFKYLCLDDEIIQNMKNIYGEWEAVKNHFIKMLVSKNISRIGQASEIIKSIAYAEENLAAKVLKGLV